MPEDGSADESGPQSPRAAGAGDGSTGERSATDLTGSVFGDRYAIERPLARGGMADVYLARDRLLDREVAVKVLFPEYSRDEAFVERFRREAQSAANLNHPNIVGVYDWGERDDTYFIVMEYVEGRTLSEIVRSEGSLHPDRAAEIAIDMAFGLGYAHRNGVVHRDVKPGNVLVTQAGQIKVTDFGIAQAGAQDQSDLTKAGSVMGTAAYFSPEQAQGKTVDPRSDLYALGCVLYEMLAGRPPFHGDSPVAVAYKHVQEQAPPPSRLNEVVPPDLDAITMKLLAKNPANRYASADDARADLRRFRDGQPVAAEPILAAALVGMASATAAGVALGGPGPEPDIEPMDDYDDLDAEAEEVEEPPRRVGVLALSLVVLLGVLGGLLFLLADALGGNDVAVASEAVPTVVEMEAGEARAVLSEAGFIPILQYAENDDFPENTVFSQNPPGGTKLEIGSEVVLQVSSGGSTVLVPEVVGLQSTAARSVLESSGFVVLEEEDWHEVAIVGEVIRQDPPFDDDVPVGSQVTIVISKGPEPVEIPDLKGRSELEAANTLNNLGFEIAIFEEESDEVEEGKVVRTDPPAGESLQPGSVVTVIISTGKSIPMPSVIGLLREQATNVLLGEGLQPSVDIVILPAGHPDNDKVLGQAPNPGELVDKGSVVVIQVGVAPPEPTTTTTTSPPTTLPPTTTSTSTP